MKNSDVVLSLVQMLKTAAQSFRIHEPVRDDHHECTLSNLFCDLMQRFGQSRFHFRPHAAEFVENEPQVRCV